MEEAFRRGWENLFDRLDGPMNFRVVIQPAVAIFFAFRAGVRDARNGQAPFLWAIFSNADHRLKLLHGGWKDVGAVFMVALMLDAIYQVIMHDGIYALELLLAATVLALVPYALLRGLVTRLVRRRSNFTQSTEAPGNTNTMKTNKKN